jgi:hypothetical protein
LKDFDFLWEDFFLKILFLHGEICELPYFFFCLKILFDVKWQGHSAPLAFLSTRRFFANVQLVWVGKHPLLNKFITLFFFTKMVIMQRRDDNIAFELPLNRP